MFSVDNTLVEDATDALLIDATRELCSTASTDEEFSAEIKTIAENLLDIATDMSDFEQTRPILAAQFWMLLATLTRYGSKRKDE